MGIPRSSIPPPRKSKGRNILGINFSKILSSEGLPIIDLSLVAIVSIIGTCITLSLIRGNDSLTFSQNTVAYNSSQYFRVRRLADGSQEFDLLVVTDLDHDSKDTEKKNTWQSIVKKGILRLNSGKNSAQIEWKDNEEFSLTTQIAAGGRAMELSDLSIFDGRLLTVDDRTGIVYEIKDNKAIPWLLLNDGPGNVTKGLKAEWLTVKNELLYVGGLGKEWTTTTGKYVNDNPMWVKIVSKTGEVRHVSWREVYIAVRRAAGIESPGYMIHEAVQWSNVHKKWFFLPRRASNEMYTEETDENKGANILIIGSEDLKSFEVVIVGEKGDGARGFSAFQFIPETNDKLIVALKSEEKDGKPVASYLSVFDVEGHVILADSPLHDAHKFEGIVFV